MAGQKEQLLESRFTPARKYNLQENSLLIPGIDTYLLWNEIDKSVTELNYNSVQFFATSVISSSIDLMVTNSESSLKLTFDIIRTSQNGNFITFKLISNFSNSSVKSLPIEEVSNLSSPLGDRGYLSIKSHCYPTIHIQRITG